MPKSSVTLKLDPSKLSEIKNAKDESEDDDRDTDPVGVSKNIVDIKIKEEIFDPDESTMDDTTEYPDDVNLKEEPFDYDSTFIKQEISMDCDVTQEELNSRIYADNVKTEMAAATSLNSTAKGRQLPLRGTTSKDLERELIRVLRENLTNVSNDFDSDRHFLLSLLDDLGNVPAPKKPLIKIRMLKAIVAAQSGQFD